MLSVCGDYYFETLLPSEVKKLTKAAKMGTVCAVGCRV